MTFNQFGKITKLLVISVFFCFLFTSCGDDDEAELEECTALTIISGDLTLNGSSANLAIAQLLVTSAFGDTNYQFQIGGTTDCEELRTVSIVLSRPDGAAIDGTYEFRDFFDAGDDDATGSVGVQNITSLTQSLSDIASGSVTITENSESNFTLDINAVPTQGAAVEMQITHQF